MDERGMERLGRIVRAAQDDHYAYNAIRRAAIGILSYLGLPPHEARSLAALMLSADWRLLEEHESFLSKRLASRGLYDNMPPLMHERGILWYLAIESYLRVPDVTQGTQLLDLGGGSGEFGTLVRQQTGCQVTVADAKNWLKVDLPFISVVNHQLDVPGKTFDQTVLMTVLHHAVDPEALLVEAIRVTRRRLVIVESVTNDLASFPYVAWVDWFYNHVVHFTPEVKDKINVPCNFMPATAWEQLIWKFSGRRPLVSQSLGIFQYLNPEPHHLLVYDLR